MRLPLSSMIISVETARRLIMKYCLTVVAFRPQGELHARFNPRPIQPPEMNIPPPKVPTSGGYQGIIPNFNFNLGGIFNMPNMGF